MIANKAGFAFVEYDTIWHSEYLFALIIKFCWLTKIGKAFFAHSFGKDYM